MKIHEILELARVRVFLFQKSSHGMSFHKKLLTGLENKFLFL